MEQFIVVSSHDAKLIAIAASMEDAKALARQNPEAQFMASTHDSLTEAHNFAAELAQLSPTYEKMILNTQEM